MYTTDMYEGMIAETITIRGHCGDAVNAYLARPLGPGPHPGMVLAHHMPGWDEWYREAARKFAHHGYATVSPDLYHRAGHGTPDDVAAKVRSEGGARLSQKLGSGEWNLVRCTFEATSTKERWRCRFEIWTENRCGCCPRLLTICCR